MKMARRVIWQRLKKERSKRPKKAIRRARTKRKRREIDHSTFVMLLRMGKLE